MKKNFFIIVSSLILLVAVFLPTASVFSFGSPFNYFGGTIKEVTYCTCYYDPAVILKVNDKLTHMDIKVKYSVFYSKLDASFNIWTPNVWVIGGTLPAGDTACRNTSGYSCSDNSGAKADSVIDFIRGIGSSLGRSMGVGI